MVPLVGESRIDVIASELKDIPLGRRWKNGGESAEFFAIEGWKPSQFLRRR